MMTHYLLEQWLSRADELLELVLLCWFFDVNILPTFFPLSHIQFEQERTSQRFSNQSLNWSIKIFECVVALCRFQFRTNNVYLFLQRFLQRLLCYCWQIIRKFSNLCLLFCTECVRAVFFSIRLLFLFTSFAFEQDNKHENCVTVSDKLYAYPRSDFHIGKCFSIINRSEQKKTTTTEEEKNTQLND